MGFDEAGNELSITDVDGVTKISRHRVYDDKLAAAGSDNRNRCEHRETVVKETWDLPSGEMRIG